jgi:hypothetical protein
VTLVKDGFRLDELRTAGFDILTILSAGTLTDESESSNSRAIAALALATAVAEQSMSQEDMQALLDDEIVLALLHMLEIDSHLSDSTAVKCAAASAIHSLCQAAASLEVSPSENMGEDMAEDIDSQPEAFLDQLLDYLVDHGVVELLMNSYHSCHLERKTAAEQALRSFSVTSTAMHALATAGAIEPLVQQLLKGSSSQRGWAAQALCRFSSERDQAQASALMSVESHCIEGLIECLNHDEVRFREAAAKALNNLAGDDADMRFIASKGALQVLVSLLNPQLYMFEGTLQYTPETSSCVSAIALTLRNLASSEKNAEAICNKTPAIRYLTLLLGSPLVLRQQEIDQSELPDWNCDVPEAAACALGGISYCSEVKLEIARSEGTLENLVHLVLDGNDR